MQRLNKLNPVARLSYLMTSYAKMDLLLYRKLAGNGFFAMHPFLEMFIDLRVDKKFHLNRLFGKFIHSADYMKAVAENLSLSKEARDVIKMRCDATFSQVEFGGLCTMWAFADLIKKSREPYVFLPVILNYGKDKNLSHQTAFLYDRKYNQLVFYEPYGTYEKYGINYGDVFNPISYILLGDEKSVSTFHQVHRLGRGTQQSVIEQNKLTADQFKQELGVVKTMYEKISDDPWRQPKPENKSFDLTIESMRILDDVEDAAFDGGDYEMLYKAYMLFYKYSAKTCVTLTFIDMYIFSRYGPRILRKFYEDCGQQKHPSKFLVDTFGGILSKIYGKKLSIILRPLANLQLTNKEVAEILKA